ncbi:hypothetical protein CVT24_012918 [Panaeolus cyanescens]|uniref:Uncharacterized protein n=1 Tax=Panaeolus cyanescens TaxID=181874 RepID=A0A409W2H4_9AGAR|nr:hypothetical protein CVT24_012918 [Panaeolus cyanescens]
MDEQLPQSQAISSESTTLSRYAVDTPTTSNLYNPQILTQVLSTILTITTSLPGAILSAFDKNSDRRQFLQKYGDAQASLEGAISNSLKHALEIQAFIYYFLNLEPVFSHACAESGSLRLERSQLDWKQLKPLVEKMGHRIQVLLDQFDNFFGLLSQAFELHPDLATETKGFASNSNVINQLDVFHQQNPIPHLNRKPTSWTPDRMNTVVFCHDSLLTFVHNLRSWWAQLIVEHEAIRWEDGMGRPDVLSSQMLNIAGHISCYIHGTHHGISGHLTRFSNTLDSLVFVAHSAKDLDRIADDIATSTSSQQTNPSLWTQEAQGDAFKLVRGPSLLLQEKHLVPLKKLFHRTRELSLDWSASIVEVNRLKKHGFFAIKLSIACRADIKDNRATSANRDIRVDPRGTPYARCTQMQIAWHLGCANGYQVASNKLDVIEVFPQNAVTDTTDVRYVMNSEMVFEPAYGDFSAGRIGRSESVEFVIPHSLSISSDRLPLKSNSGYDLRWTAQENGALKSGVRSFDLTAIVKLLGPSTQVLSTKLEITTTYAGEKVRSFGRSWKSVGQIDIGTQDRCHINLPLSSLETTFQLGDPDS